MSVEVKAAVTDSEKIVEIIKDLPANQIAEVANFAEFLQAKYKKQVRAIKNDKPRIAGLNRGEIWYSEDFADPLPEEFWNFDEDADSAKRTKKLRTNEFAV